MSSDSGWEALRGWAGSGSSPGQARPLLEFPGEGGLGKAGLSHSSESQQGIHVSVMGPLMGQVAFVEHTQPLSPSLEGRTDRKSVV